MDAEGWKKALFSPIRRIRFLCLFLCIVGQQRRNPKKKKEDLISSFFLWAANACVIGKKKREMSQTPGRSLLSPRFRGPFHRSGKKGKFSGNWGRFSRVKSSSLEVFQLKCSLSTVLKKPDHVCLFVHLIVAWGSHLVLFGGVRGGFGPIERNARRLGLGMY